MQGAVIGTRQREGVAGLQSCSVASMAQGCSSCGGGRSRGGRARQAEFRARLVLPVVVRWREQHASDRTLSGSRRLLCSLGQAGQPAVLFAPRRLRSCNQTESTAIEPM